MYKLVKPHYSIGGQETESELRVFVTGFKFVPYHEGTSKELMTFDSIDDALEFMRKISGFDCLYINALIGHNDNYEYEILKVDGNNLTFVCYIAAI
jgi:hypothetical protein